MKIKKRHDSWDSCHASIFFFLLQQRRKKVDFSSPHCTAKGSQDSRLKTLMIQKILQCCMRTAMCTEQAWMLWTLVKKKKKNKPETCWKKRSLEIKSQRIPGEQWASCPSKEPFSWRHIFLDFFSRRVQLSVKPLLTLSRAPFHAYLLLTTKWDK